MSRYLPKRPGAWNGFRTGGLENRAVRTVQPPSDDGLSPPAEAVSLAGNALPVAALFKRVTFPPIRGLHGRRL
jgi:hypothetical protein